MSKINNFQIEWQAAINTLEPMRLEAVQEIRTELEPIEEALSREGQRLALLEMLSNYEPTTEGAEAVLNSYIPSYVRNPAAIPDGRAIPIGFLSCLKQNLLKGHAAKQAANALLCACSGKVSPGLTDWPKLESWDHLMFSPADLLTWLSLLMPDQAEQFGQRIESLTEKRLELTAMLNYLSEQGRVLGHVRG